MNLRRHGGLLFAGLMLAGCQQIAQRTGTADNRANDEQSLKNADMELLKALAAKDIDKTMSYYADDATLFAPGSAMTPGKAGIRVAFTGMMAGSGLVFSGATIKSEVARSADLGYTYGNYTLSTTDASNRASTDRGKYVVVWKKEPDGSWKAVADIFNSDVPPGGTAPSGSSQSQSLQPPVPAQ